MVQPCSASHLEQVVDTMVALTRASSLQRVIVAGSDSMELYLALRRRGFMRVATPATWRIPRQHHALALIRGENSLGSIESALAQVSQFLSINACIAVTIDSRDGGFCLKIRENLTQMGFHIEAGVRCRQGLVLSARRQCFAQMECAA